MEAKLEAEKDTVSQEAYITSPFPRPPTSLLKWRVVVCQNEIF